MRVFFRMASLNPSPQTIWIENNLESFPYQYKIWYKSSFILGHGIILVNKSSKLVLLSSFVIQITPLATVSRTLC